MNIHPLLVHFPIALLTIYALMELVPFARFRLHPHWRSVKAFLCVVGSVSAFIAAQSGEMIEGSFLGGSRDKLIETHSLFANISIYIFVVLGVSYLVWWLSQRPDSWFQRSVVDRLRLRKVWLILQKIAAFALWGPVAAGIALAGLIAITITGALGGAIAHGPQVDPFVSVIYGLLIGK